jgi:hypothetical protein
MASKTIFQLIQISSMEILLLMPNAMKLGIYHLQRQIIIACSENIPQTTDTILLEWQDICAFAPPCMMAILSIFRNNCVKAPSLPMVTSIFDTVQCRV